MVMSVIAGQITSTTADGSTCTICTRAHDARMISGYLVLYCLRNSMFWYEQTIFEYAPGVDIFTEHILRYPLLDVNLRGTRAL